MVDLLNPPRKHILQHAEREVGGGNVLYGETLDFDRV